MIYSPNKLYYGKNKNIKIKKGKVFQQFLSNIIIYLTSCLFLTSMPSVILWLIDLAFKMFKKRI